MNKTSKPIRLVKSDSKRNRKSSGKSNSLRRGRRNKPNLNPPNRWNTYSNAGRQALQDINYLRRFINTETNYTDAVVNGVASSTTATFTLLNGIQLGDTAATRTGQSVKCVKIDLNIAVVGNQSATSILGRILVVMDKQANAATFAVGDLLNATTVTSMFTIGNQMRFSVLYDESYAMNINGNFCFVERKLLNCQSHTEYNTGNAGTVADINTNSIYLIHFTDQATNTPLISFYSRYWFVDN